MENPTFTQFMNRTYYYQFQLSPYEFLARLGISKYVQTLLDLSVTVGRPEAIINKQQKEDIHTDLIANFVNFVCMFLDILELDNLQQLTRTFSWMFRFPPDIRMPWDMRNLPIIVILGFRGILKHIKVLLYDQKYFTCLHKQLYVYT